MAENSRETFKYIEWKVNGIIDRFRGFQDNGRHEEIRSPSFNFNNAEWFLKIDGSLFICLHKLNPEEHSVKFRIGMQKSDGSNTNIIEDSFSFAEGCNNCAHDFKKQFAMVERSTDIWTPDGTLTIFCFICLDQESPMDIESRTPLPEAEMPAAKRPKTNSRQNGDVLIIVQGTEFVAERFYLMQYSNYFRKELFDKAPSSKNKEILFRSLCDIESFEQFLEFLYKGNIDIVTPNNMYGLYKNSHYCDAPSLKEDCIRFMQQELSMRTFIDIYDLSCECFHTDLLNSIVRFFMGNAKNIVISTKWQEYLEKKADLGNKLFLNYLSFNNST